MNIFYSLIMPMNVFGSTGTTTTSTMNTTLFVQKDIDMKQQYKFKNLLRSY